MLVVVNFLTTCSNWDAVDTRVPGNLLTEIQGIETCCSLVFTARRSDASGVFGVVILSVCLSVHPSVKHVLCDKMKQES